MVDEPLQSIRLSDIIRESEGIAETPQRTIRVRRAVGEVQDVKIQDSQISGD